MNKESMTNEEAIEQLKQIPIAQDVVDGYMCGIYEAIDIAIKALEQQPKWVPVSERLPEEWKNVLVQFILGGMMECYLSFGKWHIVGGGRKEIEFSYAWRELPQPYERR